MVTKYEESGDTWGARQRATHNLSGITIRETNGARLRRSDCECEELGVDLGSSHGGDLTSRVKS